MNKHLPMTRGRMLTLIIGVPLILFIVGVFALHEVAYVAQGSYPVRVDVPAHGRPVTVAVDAGNVALGQAAADRLRLTGTAHYALFRSTVTWSGGASGFTVNSRCHFVLGQCSFSYTGALPAGSAVVLDIGSGTITLTGITGARVTANAGSGGVTLAFSKVPDVVSVSIGVGDVVIVLPPGPSAYRVSAHAGIGSTSIGVPTSESSTHIIDVSDGSGNISIRNH